MNVSICGVDATADFGATLAALAQDLALQPAAPQPLARGHSALFLRTAENEHDYASMFTP